MYHNEMKISASKQAAQTPETGNVLFYVLIAVALLAALTFAVSESGRGNIKKLSDERARLYATEIIEYGNILANAVAQTRLRGYTAEQISFENNTIAGYTNANCTDDICKIFHPSGGGVNYMSPPEDANDGSSWFIGGDTCIDQIGTGTSNCNSLTSVVNELILFLPDVDESVCVQINELLGIDNPSGSPPAEALNSYNEANKWTGTYANLYAIGGVFVGVSTACYRAAGPLPPNGTYNFYKVLIAR